jgi:response regulator of citrate/malate metabolism
MNLQQTQSNGNKPLSTGKFATRMELIAKVAQYKRQRRSQEHCARVCGVSRSTIAKIYRAL